MQALAEGENLPIAGNATRDGALGAAAGDASLPIVANWQSRAQDGGIYDQAWRRIKWALCSYGIQEISGYYA